MAKQNQNTVSNVSRISAQVFALLPVSVQDLLTEADKRNELLDFSTIQPFNGLPRAMNGFFANLENIARNITSAEQFKTTIVDAVEQESQAAKQAANQGQLAWWKKVATWLGDNVGKMRVMTQFENGVRLLTPYNDKKSCCLVYLGDDVKGRTNYREVVMILNEKGEKQPVENMLRLDPIATAHLLNRILEVVRNILDSCGVKESEKRKDIIFAEPLIAELADYLASNGSYGEGTEKRKARVSASSLPLK